MLKKIFKNKNEIFTLSESNSTSIILHHHLGLGDNIICNGLVNKISKNFDKIFLPVKVNYMEMIKFLYSDNKKITFFEVSDKNSNEDVEKYSNANNLQVLKIGFNKVKNNDFNTWFYEQLGFPYEDSYKYFHIPNDEGKGLELKEHLFKFYNIDSEEYILVHNESHDKQFNLNEINNKNIVHISPKSDKFNNIFFYKTLIKNAKEIHCINSSFLHLVERIPTNSNLIYHHIRKSKFKLHEKWKVIKYED